MSGVAAAIRRAALPFLLGALCGLAVYTLFESFATSAPAEGANDPRHVGLSWVWLAFGFGAQALFTGRMLVQWMASEKAKSSVVPVQFWWLSLIGGLMLLIYFLRRGDPVGVVGQAFGVFVYARNLFFLRRGAGSNERTIEELDRTR